MGRYALPCVVCEKELLNVDEASTNQPSEGLAFITHGHYGGTVFDPMDGRYLELNVCDECLLKLAVDKHVLLGQDRKLVTITSGPLPSVIGSTPVHRELVPWDPDAQERDDAVHFSDWQDYVDAREQGLKIDSRFTDEELRAMFPNDDSPDPGEQERSTDTP